MKEPVNVVVFASALRAWLARTIATEARPGPRSEAATETVSYTEADSVSDAETETGTESETVSEVRDRVPSC